MRKGLKANLGKTMVMVCSNITNDGMTKSKIDPCGVHRLGVGADSVLCVQCGRYAGVKRVSPKFSRNCTYRKCLM